MDSRVRPFIPAFEPQLHCSLAGEPQFGQLLGAAASPSVECGGAGSPGGPDGSLLWSVELWAQRESRSRLRVAVRMDMAPAGPRLQSPHRGGAVGLAGCQGSELEESLRCLTLGSDLGIGLLRVGGWSGARRRYCFSNSGGFGIIIVACF